MLSEVDEVGGRRRVGACPGCCRDRWSVLGCGEEVGGEEGLPEGEGFAGNEEGVEGEEGENVRV